MPRVLLSALLVLAYLLGTGPEDAGAQSTGGVFGPVVNDGHRSAQYRVGFDPDSEIFAQRLHYQQAVNTSLMWRVVAQTRRTAASDFDFDFVQAELFWELRDSDLPWRTGLRFDARIRDDGRPGQLGVNWMNDLLFSEGWTARLLALTAVEVGDGARDGVAFQTRARLHRVLSDRVAVGGELFSSYGTLDDLQAFDSQSHQLGPYLETGLGRGWSLYANVLFGVTEASVDEDLRFWVTRVF